MRRDQSADFIIDILSLSMCFSLSLCENPFFGSSFLFVCVIGNTIYLVEMIHQSSCKSSSVVQGNDGGRSNLLSSSLGQSAQSFQVEDESEGPTDALRS